MENPLPTVVVRNHAYSDDELQQIRGQLAGAGLVADDRPVAHGPVVLLVDRPCQDVLAEIADRGRGGATLVLAMNFRSTLGPHEDLQFLAAGAADVLAGAPVERLCQEAASRVAEWHRVEGIVRRLADAGTCVGRSVAWTRVLREVVRAATGGALPILLQGETGTGKEMIARLVHELAGPSPGPFVTVDCSTIAGELSGSELFGHVRGAFTGAHAEREGAFAAAHGGTLFLDEIGELPPALQPEFLRVLQEGTYKAVGSNVWHRASFRLVSATHRDLDASQFRQDLFFRIAGWRVRLPPLAERTDDIRPLVEHFLRESCRSAAEVPEISANLWSFLDRRPYPGNVRELRNVVRRLVLRSGGSRLLTLGAVAPDDRPPSLPPPHGWREELARAAETALVQGIGLREFAEESREQLVLATVRAEGGSLPRAARRLGVTDRALQIRAAGKRNGRLPR